ncbi:hypothetical protein EJ08DRAFT_657352 [Tothia fuscella]|uniref:HTH cro/C1-type domain-containing protein n=1 Tax=Tothia fuscella TaxID=1048955 RepID=A0A9P4U1F8_9PEZI|nr:hypothetical protein EJ08DRAFT_657352 [Tothia fuscella]
MDKEMKGWSNKKDPQDLVRQQIELAQRIAKAKQVTPQASVNGNNKSTGGGLRDKLYAPSMARKEQEKSIPDAVFDTAYQKGFLNINGTKCRILRGKFEQMGMEPTADKLVGICKYLQVDIDDVVQISRIQLKSRNAWDRRQGQLLLATACRAGSRTAIVYNLHLAYKQSQFNHSSLAKERNAFNSLVREGTYVPALMLAAKVHESQGNSKAAMDLYMRITSLQDDATFTPIEQSSATNKSESEAELELIQGTDLDICSAWLAMADKHCDGDPDTNPYYDFDKSKECFRRAALDFDDPRAYIFLSQCEDGELFWEDNENSVYNDEDGRKVDERALPLLTSDWINFRIKAAASGDAESAYRLGQVYSLPLEKIDTIKDRVVRDEILNHPCIAWPQRLDNMALSFVNRFRPEPTEDPTGLIQKGMDHAKLRGAQWRALYAEKWFEIAYDAGYSEAILECARIRWFRQFYQQAVELIRPLRSGNPARFGTQWDFIPREALALVQEWMKTPEGESLYKNNQVARECVDEMLVKKKYVLKPLKSGYEASPAVQKLMREKEAAK